MQEEMSTQGPPAKLVSEELKTLFFVMNNVVLLTAVSLVGLVTNVMNIIVFIKQGLREQTNVAFCGLSVGDLGNALCLFLMSLCYNPLLIEASTTFHLVELQHLTAGWARISFSRITSWITAFIALERCLCVAWPLKVKQILTPKRSAVIICSIYIIMVLLGIFPAVSAMYFDWKFFPDRNMTLIGLKFHAGGGETKLVSFSLNVISLLFSFLLVVVCTAILVYKLISKTKWRQEMSGAAPDVKQTSVSRDQKVVKMVVFISAVYIGCFFWSAVSMIISMLVPGYSVVGPNKNMFQTVWSFLLLLEGTNSSVNMFIYLKMSSKFRKVFTETFSFRRQNSVKTR